MTVSTCIASGGAAKGQRVLIIGATGFIGQFIAEASLSGGRPTYLLVRSSSSNAKTMKVLQDKGAMIIHGVMKDEELMEKILKENEIDIVISAVGGQNILDQLNLVRAIKSVGTIKKKIGRSLPRVTVSEDDLLAAAAVNIIPQSIVASFTHDIFIRGCQVNFSIDGPKEVEVCDLYPDESFKTVEDCFEDYMIRVDDTSKGVANGIVAQNHVVDALPITAMCA
ncbi:hypothetical protein RHGRI_033892 [Rhododendron griersonianum]|uniref:NmrA-like domain-containing protein n=1 Tax=Rhododendron griersonianum TaxID=479676 RepID=A0AAV6I440_9ERIC|nr:hypothetical protein RHGRI_033892 [Rhododendron griersonianum]